MNFQDYQTKAQSYRLPSSDEQYVLLNLSAEVGEFMGHLAKAIRDQTQVDVDILAKELGDILWHISALCDDMGIGLDAVALMNLDKLESRRLRNALQGSGDNR